MAFRRLVMPVTISMVVVGWRFPMDRGRSRVPASRWDCVTALHPQVAHSGDHKDQREHVSRTSTYVHAASLHPLALMNGRRCWPPDRHTAHGGRARDVSSVVDTGAVTCGGGRRGMVVTGRGS